MVRAPDLRNPQDLLLADVVTEGFPPPAVFTPGGMPPIEDERPRLSSLP